MMTARRERLRSLIEKRCLITGVDVTLSTGTHSSFYFDCKAATLDGECLALIVDEFLEEIDQLSSQPDAIGGLTMGADFIAAALIDQAYRRGHPTRHGSIVRKEPKKHGTRNRIENQLPPGTPIVVIDDVITSGSSIRIACDEFIAAGYQIVGMLAVIDRQAGGREALENDFGPVRTLFLRDDFPSLRQNPAAAELTKTA